jgi:hypothetical protein
LAFKIRTKHKKNPLPLLGGGWGEGQKRQGQALLDLSPTLPSP